jgi:NAD(P)-dependent dehydrogenase (short-subunit alcohol dehydrogenase family)
MRKARYGHIIAVTGITGAMGFPGLGARCAADAALEGMLEAMAFEVAPFGVRVSVLQPGLGVVNVRQEEKVEEGLEGVKKVCREESGGEEEGGVLEVVERIAGRRDPPVRVAVGEDVVESVKERLKVVSEELEEMLEASLGCDIE